MRSERVLYYPSFILFVSLAFAFTAANVRGEIIFESGTLGPTGVSWSDIENQTTFGANVSSTVFEGVRFELTNRVLVSEVGGHFVAPDNSEFFGAIIKLDDENDFPNSGGLSTSDVLGTTLLSFPNPSAEVFESISLSLDPGWYALVFGSGLFGTTGVGAMPLNNPDIGTQSYIAFVGAHWKNSAPTDGFEFKDFRFVVKGRIIPEPSTLCDSPGLSDSGGALTHAARTGAYSASNSLGLL